MKKAKVLGILLILLGIAICATGIGVFTAVLWERYERVVYWHFDTFADYFWAVSKSNMACAFLAGCIPAGIGTYLLRCKK